MIYKHDIDVFVRFLIYNYMFKGYLTKFVQNEQIFLSEKEVNLFFADV